MHASDVTRRGKAEVCPLSFRGDAKHRATMCNCTSENLEIPGLVLTHHPGMTTRLNGCLKTERESWLSRAVRLRFRFAQASPDTLRRSFNGCATRSLKGEAWCPWPGPLHRPRSKTYRAHCPETGRLTQLGKFQRMSRRPEGANRCGKVRPERYREKANYRKLAPRIRRS